MDNLPFVSVIVPVYNASEFIRKLLDRLLGQDYPKDRCEFIIVDNNSKDDTKDIIREYPFVLAKEDDIQSSYAARNKGLSIAKGDVIAFTDADCQPVVSWLRNGVEALVDGEADVVAGNVEFVYSPKPTAAEIFDSLTHMQMESEVKNKGVAPTANIFTTRKMFDNIGLFDSRVKSGGDVQWTRKATQSGYKLIYCKDAIVKHPTRNFLQFTKKVMRTGAGSAHARLAAGHSILHEFFYMPYAVVFKVSVNKELLKERYQTRGIKRLNVKLSRVIAVGLVTNVVSHFSAMIEFWRILALITLGKYKEKSNE